MTHSTASNDTLVGGKGNDSLYSDPGNDLFVYAQGDGKDFIIGFNVNGTNYKISGSNLVKK